MELIQDSPVLCKSIFKDGKSEPTTAQFTGMWIEMIRRLEAGRNADVSVPQEPEP